MEKLNPAIFKLVLVFKIKSFLYRGKSATKKSLTTKVTKNSERKGYKERLTKTCPHETCPRKNGEWGKKFIQDNL